MLEFKPHAHRKKKTQRQLNRVINVAVTVSAAWKNNNLNLGALVNLFCENIIAIMLIRSLQIKLNARGDFETPRTRCAFLHFRSPAVAIAYANARVLPPSVLALFR